VIILKIETKRKDNYVSLFVRLNIPFVKKTFRWHTILYNSPDAWVHGYSSRTQDGRYVLFHDYDNLDKESIVNELKYLQEVHNLGDYYLFRMDRENSFHAVCIDTFSLRDAYKIQQETACDLAFIHSIKNLQTKEWILRWGKKGFRDCPEFDCVVKSKYGCRIKSMAHGLFMKKMGVAIDMKKGKWDGNKLLAFVDYDTANRIK